MMDTLTKFLQVCPLDEETEEDISQSFWKEWIVRYGAPSRLTADNDIRWRSKKGVWSQMLRFHGVEAHYTTPYRHESNGRCERHVREFNQALRAVRQELPELSVRELLPLVCSVLNAQPVAGGKTSFELFHENRLPWYDATLDFSFPVSKSEK